MPGFDKPNPGGLGEERELKLKWPHLKIFIHLYKKESSHTKYIKKDYLGSFTSINDFHSHHVYLLAYLWTGSS